MSADPRRDVEISEDGQSSVVHYGGFTTPSLDAQIDRALALMKGDEIATAQLVSGWLAAGQIDRAFIGDLVRSHISRRVQLAKSIGEHISLADAAELLKEAAK